jgi:hypothetical protein
MRLTEPDPRGREGPLTRDLLREPGAFGLGQVPARLAPDCHHDDGVRLLLDRLRPHRSPARGQRGEPLAGRTIP